MHLHAYIYIGAYIHTYIRIYPRMLETAKGKMHYCTDFEKIRHEKKTRSAAGRRPKHLELCTCTGLHARDLVPHEFPLPRIPTGEKQTPQKCVYVTLYCDSSSLSTRTFPTPLLGKQIYTTTASDTLYLPDARKEASGRAFFSERLSFRL